MRLLFNYRVIIPLFIIGFIIIFLGAIMHLRQFENSQYLIIGGVIIKGTAVFLFILRLCGCDPK